MPHSPAQAGCGSVSIQPGARRQRTRRSTFKTSLPRRWRGVPASPRGEMRGNPGEALLQPLDMLEHALGRRPQRRGPLCLQVSLPFLLFHLLNIVSFCLLTSVCGVCGICVANIQGNGTDWYPDRKESYYCIGKEVSPLSLGACDGERDLRRRASSSGRIYLCRWAGPATERRQSADRF